MSGGSIPRSAVNKLEARANHLHTRACVLTCEVEAEGSERLRLEL